MKGRCASIIGALCLVSVVLVAPCRAENNAASVDELKKRAGETVDAAKELTAQQKEELRKKLEAEVVELSGKIEALKRKMAEAKQDASGRAQDVMQDLEVKKNEAQKRVEELRSSGAKAWGLFKSGSEKAIEDLYKAYRDAESVFK